MLYFVLYWNSGTPNTAGPYVQAADAQAAATWFQSLSGTTYVQTVSTTTTAVSTWGTAPTA